MLNEALGIWSSQEFLRVVITWKHVKVLSSVQYCMICKRVRTFSFDKLKIEFMWDSNSPQKILFPTKLKENNESFILWYISWLIFSASCVRNAEKFLNVKNEKQSKYLKLFLIIWWSFY